MKQTVIIILVLTCMAGAAMRYPVGRPVPVEIYTMPFEGNPCDPNDPSFDPAYKFLQMPTPDWMDQCGANERTLLIHAISELRVVVATQGRMLMELQARLNAISDPNIPIKASAELSTSEVKE
jgi:hypothetical protein